MRFRQVHLDFHTSEKIGGIGERFDKEQFQAALKEGHVDSVTVFAKCHHGWAYFPSETNQMHPNLKFDLLGAQIEAAHEIGVKTPVYLSAGVDFKELKNHPDWIERLCDGSTGNVDSFTTPYFHRLCFNSPYLGVLLSQIKEVCEKYDADGIFLDIVNISKCCCPYCLKKLFERGKRADDEQAILELGEETYKNYLRRVRETIDSVKPGLPVFHNGGHIRHGRRELAYANTHLELESLPTGGWGYDHFPLSAAYAETLGAEYLGMTGKFHGTWGEFGGFKHKNALRYEVSLAAAFGAKSSIGDQLAPSGEMDILTYKNIGFAYSELEKKEPWLVNSCGVADIALLSNEAVSNLEIVDAEEARNCPAMEGAVRILLEGNFLFHVIDCEADFTAYKVIILADSVALPPEVVKRLQCFVASGGKILASGASAVKDGKMLFDFGVKYIGKCNYEPDYMRPEFEADDVYETDFVMRGGSEVVENIDGQVYAKHIKPYFNRSFEHFCSHQHTPSSGEENGSGIVEGKDGIYICWNIFSDYRKNGMLICKRAVCFALDRLLGDRKTLTTSLPPQGVVTLRKQEKMSRYILHLLHAVPTVRGTDTQIIEEICPLSDVKVCVMLTSVKRIYLAPQNREIDFKVSGQCIEFNVKKLDCHQMVVIDR